MASDDFEDTAKAEIEKAMNQALLGMSPANKNSEGIAKREINEDGEEILYMEPMQDPYGKAIRYLEKHNILQLFQALTTNIVYSKPNDPLGYMMQEIQKMKAAEEKQKT